MLAADGREGPYSFNLVLVLAAAEGRVVQCERRVGDPPFREFALKIYSRARLRKNQQFAHDAVTGRMTAITGERKVAAEVRMCARVRA